VALLLLDIVNLKAVNDRFGYPVGDDVLRTVAEVLETSARRTGLLARYGGDEFALLWSETPPARFNRIAERLDTKLAALGRSRNLPLAVQFAIGVATAPVPPPSADDLIRQADKDLQRRKLAQRRPTGDHAARSGEKVPPAHRSPSAA
jgi:diguanylate cyclase (GGDEF)-like protein